MKAYIIKTRQGFFFSGFTEFVQKIQDAFVFTSFEAAQKKSVELLETYIEEIPNPEHAGYSPKLKEFFSLGRKLQQAG